MNNSTASQVDEILLPNQPRDTAVEHQLGQPTSGRPYHAYRYAATQGLVMMLLALLALEVGFEIYRFAQVTYDPDWDSTLSGPLVAIILVWMARLAVLCVWTYRVCRNQEAIGASGLRFTPGWAVAWWFVPVFNLFRPLQVMDEIFRNSAERSPTSSRWPRFSEVELWWGLNLGGWVFSLLACLPFAGGARSNALIFLDACFIVATSGEAIMLAMIARLISTGQDRRRTLMGPGSREFSRVDSAAR